MVERYWAKSVEDKEKEDLEEEIEPVEYRGYGFKSKTTEMAKGKVNIKGERIREKKRRKEELGMMRPKKKPSIARFIPRPIMVREDRTGRSIIGIPAGHSGLKPVQTSFRPPTSIFGDGKKKMRLF